MGAVRPGAVGVAVTLVVAAVAGCGGDDEQEEATAPRTATEERTATDRAGARVTVKLDEFSFAPRDLKVDRGATVVARNVGSIAHNLTIERGTSPREASEELAGTRPFSAGKSEELEVRLAPGRYSMVCTVPGHRESGMFGTITVE